MYLIIGSTLLSLGLIMLAYMVIRYLQTHMTNYNLMKECRVCGNLYEFDNLPCSYCDHPRPSKWNPLKYIKDTCLGCGLQIPYGCRRRCPECTKPRPFKPEREIPRPFFKRNFRPSYTTHHERELKLKKEKKIFWQVIGSCWVLWQIIKFNNC